MYNVKFTFKLIYQMPNYNLSSVITLVVESTPMALFYDRLCCHSKPLTFNFILCRIGQIEIANTILIK